MKTKKKEREPRGTKFEILLRTQSWHTADGLKELITKGLLPLGENPKFLRVEVIKP